MTSKRKPLPSQEELQNAFFFNGSNLIHKINHLRVKAGTVAGCVNHYGYVVIRYNSEKYYAHRLIWIYLYGKIFTDIDHINGIRNDNRQENLREVTRAENNQNLRKPRSVNKSGFLGVSFKKQANAYVAQICVNKTVHHLGLYKTPEEAHEAYLTAKRKWHKTCTI